jgi:large subunit ribosomal protein L10
MALSKEQKNDVVKEATDLLQSSKMTVFAQYKGIGVKSMQALRKNASGNNTKVRVIKNRLVIKAIKQVPSLSDIDTSMLKEQLLYAFNPDDEVAAAQSLNTFAKTEPNLVFVGGISADGIVLSADDIKAVASLPTKDQLRAQLVGTIAAPLSGFANVLNSNLRGVLNVLNARAENV